MTASPDGRGDGGIERDRVVPRLEELLGKVVEHRKVRHAVIGAAAIDGSWEWCDAAGEANPDGTTMGPETPWFLASVTKLYIASIVLRLYEQGLVDLNAPIPVYLPNSLKTGVHVWEGVDRTAEVTVAHLLAHATGLPDSLVEHRKGEPGLVAEIEAGDVSFSLGDAVERVRSLKPHFAPSNLEGDAGQGAVFRYELSAIDADRRAGERTADRVLHRSLLFEPLGLRHTWFPGDEALGDVGRPATPWLNDWPLQDRPKALQSLGDLFGTTGDVLRFGRALFSRAGVQRQGHRRVDVQPIPSLRVPAQRSSHRIAGMAHRDRPRDDALRAVESHGPWTTPASTVGTHRINCVMAVVRAAPWTAARRHRRSSHKGRSPVPGDPVSAPRTRPMN